MIRFLNKIKTKNSSYDTLQATLASYVQGQSPEPKLREYFYFIDHQGMLYLDDSKMKNFTSCFKEKKFLEFFFKRIQINKTGRYEKEFPYLSLCGRERNYIRCDDLPIVFTHIVNKTTNNQDLDLLTFGYAGDSLSTPFIPDNIYMSPATGRVYHPADKVYGGIGLIRSKLAIELSKYFEFHKGDQELPTHITWKGQKYELDIRWIQNLDQNVNIITKDK